MVLKRRPSKDTDYQIIMFINLEIIIDREKDIQIGNPVFLRVSVTLRVVPVRVLKSETTGIYQRQYINRNSKRG